MWMWFEMCVCLPEHVRDSPLNQVCILTPPPAPPGTQTTFSRRTGARRIRPRCISGPADDAGGGGYSPAWYGWGACWLVALTTQCWLRLRADWSPSTPGFVRATHADLVWDCFDATLARQFNAGNLAWGLNPQHSWGAEEEIRIATPSAVAAALEIGSFSQPSGLGLSRHRTRASVFGVHFHFCLCHSDPRRGTLPTR